MNFQIPELDGGAFGFEAEVAGACDGLFLVIELPGVLRAVDGFEIGLLSAVSINAFVCLGGKQL